jgi:exopolysaccharide production protein ExoZ
MKRLHELDYLRGLAAFGIMVFHYLSWTRGEFSAADTMGRIGIYGVAIFYILSGLTLFHAYNESLSGGWKEARNFFKRRILRIYPLLIVSIILSILIFRQGQFQIGELILNVTGLFGFIDWSHTIAVGSWSIGNELVFYVFFPIFAYLFHRNKASFIIFCFVIFATFLYFAFILHDPSSSLSSEVQRSYYFNPLNHLFLFLGGYLIGAWLEHLQLRSLWASVLILSGCFLFIAWPEEGDRIRLVCGNTRMALTASCFLICIGFYKSNYPLPPFAARPLSMLGEISYSVYMLHPIVHRSILYPINYVRAHFFAVPESMRFALAVALTLVISYFVYQYFEKYFIRLGKKRAVISS